MEKRAIATFGDVRRAILDTVEGLQNGSITPTLGMALAANFKVLNDNVQVEINAAKLALATEGKAHNFGRVVSMGRKMIGNDNTTGEST